MSEAPVYVVLRGSEALSPAASGRAAAFLLAVDPRNAEGRARRLEQWGEGPWMREPDLVVWRAHGLMCSAARSWPFGALCGYVGVPGGHPLHGVDIDDERMSLGVHWGVTFAADRAPFAKDEPDPEGLWFLGFDCGHAGDFQPGLHRKIASLVPPPTLPGGYGYEPPPWVSSGDATEEEGREPWSPFPEVYRALPFVLAETERLALQLRALAAEGAS